jgi:hypothetical protein
VNWSVLLLRPGWGMAGLAAAVLAVGALAAWLAWPSAPAIPGASRVRQYLDVRACLLTGPTGVTTAPAAAAWAGMEGASRATRAMVSYQPVAGPATRAAALPYLASLVQRRCRVIVAVGAGPAAAASADAARFRQVRFVVVAGGAPGPGVTLIPPAPAAHLHQAVQAAVSAAVAQSPAQ